MHLYGTEVWTHEIIPVSVCREELETRCELRDGERSELNEERASLESKRFPRVYSRQFGERNRKRALSRGKRQWLQTDRGEGGRKRGVAKGLGAVPGKRNRAGS